MNFFRTFNAVLNGLSKATLEDGFKTRIFFLFPFCTCAVFVWAKCAQKLRVLHWRNKAPRVHFEPHSTDFCLSYNVNDVRNDKITGATYAQSKVKHLLPSKTKLIGYNSIFKSHIKYGIIACRIPGCSLPLTHHLPYSNPSCAYRDDAKTSLFPF